VSVPGAGGGVKMPDISEAWEYWTGDPEVEEFLAEQANPRGLRAGDKMPGAFFDNRGYGFIRSKIKTETDTKPRKTNFHRGLGFVKRGYQEVIDSVWGQLKRHGPNTVAGVSLSEGLDRWSVQSALRRKAGLMFKVVGCAPLRNQRGCPGLVWSVVTDDESAMFVAGKRTREDFLSDRRTMFIRFPGMAPKTRARHEPFTWVAA
jgi:hypothetical protein